MIIKRTQYISFLLYHQCKK